MHARPCGPTASRVSVDIRYTPHLSAGQHLRSTSSAIPRHSAFRPSSLSCRHASAKRTPPLAGRQRHRPALCQPWPHLPLRSGGLAADLSSMSLHFESCDLTAYSSTRSPISGIPHLAVRQHLHLTSAAHPGKPVGTDNSTVPNLEPLQEPGYDQGGSDDALPVRMNSDRSRISTDKSTETTSRLPERIRSGASRSSATLRPPCLGMKRGVTANRLAPVERLDCRPRGARQDPGGPGSASKRPI